jgi:hypothetical protein
MISLLAWALVAGGAGWLIGFPVYRLLSRLGLLDKPNDRSSHSVPNRMFVFATFEHFCGQIKAVGSFCRKKAQKARHAPLDGRWQI